MSQQNGAEVLIDILNGYGVEAMFSSPGSEWPPLWEALARRQAAKQPAPVYYNARHEDLAIGQAMGYARATGKLGVCLVHATVGTLHASMGIRAAYHEQIPLLVLAGESVTFGEGPDAWVGAQWGRFLADHGGPARLVDAFCKSSFGLNTPSVLAGAVHRACALAMGAPQGPVFLSLPFEHLHQPAVLPAPTRYAFPATPQPQRAPLEQAAAWLKAAKSPLIIVENAARTAGEAARLVQLAERLGAGVVEGQHPGFVNFPRDHALHAGFYAQAYLKDVDAVLMLEAPGPWYPPTAMTPPAARLINVAQDPLRERDPYTGFTADLQIQGDAMAAVDVLLDLIPTATAGADQRQAAWAERSVARRAQWREQALQNAGATPIDARFLCHELNACLPDDAVIVDETILSHHTIINVMDRLKPGHFINALSGGLGLGLGMGLGTAVGLAGQAGRHLRRRRHLQLQPGPGGAGLRAAVRHRHADRDLQQRSLPVHADGHRVFVPAGRGGDPPQPPQLADRAQSGLWPAGSDVRWAWREGRGPGADSRRGWPGGGGRARRQAGHSGRAHRRRNRVPGQDVRRLSRCTTRAASP